MAPTSTKTKKDTPAPYDGTTRQDDSTPLQGHFVTIDLANEDALKGVEAAIGEGNAGPGSGDYGVFNHPSSYDEHGQPVTVTVTLRDEHACMVVVPYAALRPSQPGRR